MKYIFEIWFLFLEMEHAQYLTHVILRLIQTRFLTGISKNYLLYAKTKKMAAVGAISWEILRYRLNPRFYCSLVLSLSKVC